MAIRTKIIKLDEAVLKALHLQAIGAGFNNLQNYLEFILIEKSKK